MKRHYKKALLSELRQGHKLWRVRTALFWGLFNGALLAFTAAFSGLLDPWVYLAINAVGYSIFAVAKFLHRPGTDV